MPRQRHRSDRSALAARAWRASGIALLALGTSCVTAPPDAEPVAPRAVDWELLAGFAWEPGEPGESGADSPVPAAIAALDGRAVEIEAELAPITWGEDSELGYVLTRLPNSCCLCVLPPFTEWIELLGGSTAELERRIFGRVRIRGVLAVGPQRDEWGYVRSFYRLREPRVVQDSPSGD